MTSQNKILRFPKITSDKILVKTLEIITVRIPRGIPGKVRSATSAEIP